MVFRISGFLIFFSIFISLHAHASEDVNVKQEQCIQYYDDLEKQIEPIVEDISKHSGQEEWQDDAQKSYYMEALKLTMDLADKVQDCGQHDDRYYFEEEKLCHGYIYSKSMKKFFDLLGKGSFYCDSALNRGSEQIFLQFIMGHMSGPNYFQSTLEKDYAKAISYIDDLTKKHDKHHDLLAFKAQMLLRGGYGVEQDAQAAFRIIKHMVENGANDNLKCELSLYYKDGVGTKVNQSQSEHWLQLYKDARPDQACEYMDFSNIFND